MKERYFDYNATTPLCEAARVAWLEASESLWLNPSSPYRHAAKVRVRYEEARESLAKCFGVDPARVVFTSGATEANNAVLRHWLESLPTNARIGVNPTEHSSVMETAKALFGKRVEWLPILRDGRVDLEVLRERIQAEEVAAVSVMAANNETGVLQPWQKIVQLCKQAQVPYHCDASQWVGKMPVQDLSACSYVTACAHKFGGPKGVGFMLLPEAGDSVCVLHGGAQEAGHRAGTEDVAAVLAMLAALEQAPSGGSEARDTFIERVVEAVPGTTVVGVGAERLWNTVSLILPRHQSERWIRSLEKRGFLLSAGSACATGQATSSHVLPAMGISATEAGRVLRISAGGATPPETWLALADALATIYEQFNQAAESAISQVITID